MGKCLEKASIACLAGNNFAIISAIEKSGQDHPWSDDSLMAELCAENAFHFGAFITEGRLTAFLLARLILDELHIHHVCTHPEFRRRGFAGSLLCHAQLIAQNRGATKAFLEVAASNGPARGLYHQAGFKDDFIRKGYYSNGDDAMVMSKNLMQTER